MAHPEAAPCGAARRLRQNGLPNDVVAEAARSLLLAANRLFFVAI
jgi:hypothetical protein